MVVHTQWFNYDNKINGTNTAASPAITGADTDTGLSFGTDTVNINTGGTTKVKN